ncbi:protein MpRWP1 [Marchantia polymorpha subsp. ruderalis]|uniref:RWP-RK domain-containing protein n=2 Tax=Marchantia polymorpha TaxID=3197 RepID=A0AAF6B2F4_MARPO|nr:hypothetical protein MARPO_0049s0118 [Marchantia polymorpha]BBN06188.1 hypothetical protein Mp_3g19150 [Marchantia polymorpha subsp. ruderalis]BBN06189.1 hypothetical protein Mp_3g19160 [Marchantia polymorpha subsp. ruderalis]|eukprot:PTQ38846.1 hypothetical protein MARPO_0049s0118 [Marchantia polymorpha]
MAGGQLGSPNCDGVVLNSFNSPRFDISEFLKTPKDSTSEEPFFNFAGFNIPTPTFNLLNPLPPFNSRRNPRGEGSEPDFSALLFDKGVESEGTSVDDTLNGELIAFDEIDADIAKDSFALFSGTHENFLNHPISPLRINVPYHSAGTRIPLNFPPPMFTQGSYLGGEPGGLMEVEDRALASMEHGASTSGGANPLMCPSTPMDWSMPREGALQTNSSQQHNTLQCDSCQILRRIIHSNGVQDTKLEIHGCDGQSYHAVLQTRFCIDDGFPATLEQQMVEFPVGNAEYVKQFLLQYSLLRRKEGFVLRHDSLSAGQSKLHRSGSMDSGEHTETAMTPVKPPKSNAAAQRERTGKLKMSDLAQHFHLPINAAAKELGICPTVLKKICRRNGMRRWPHRKIKSIERIIATLEQTIAEGAGQGDEGIRMEIAMLRNERAQLCAGLLERPENK